ncbi:MAG TPA: potassium channel family protein [Candidatus Babeliales bacterium]|nr:potassium channel family protein [Candidatus Babeliales bacterium]
MKNNLDKYLYRYLLTAALAALVTGTLVYHTVEHLSWLNAYYFSVITLTTVGYGDITPHTATGKIFTTFYVMFGIGIITTFISLRMQRRGEKLAKRHEKSDHKD